MRTNTARGRVLHDVCADEPSATSKRSQKARCGEWVRPNEVARNADHVTCEDCRRLIAEYDAMTF